MNKSKLIAFLVGNLSNAVVHRILEQAIEEEIIRLHYEKELNISLKIALKYREKLNPKLKPLPAKDIDKIRIKIKNKALAELKKRILNGYENIDLTKIDKVIDLFFNKINIS